MADEDYAQSSLFMDRGGPLGNSLDRWLRRALHTKIANSESEAVPVYLVEGGTQTLISTFNDISAVAAGVETTVTTYTVPVGKVFYLQRVEVSGSNIAEYWLKIANVVVDKRYSWFTKGLSDLFDFSGGLLRGLKVNAGVTVKVTVRHGRPFAGDFNARIQGVEVDL